MKLITETTENIEVITEEKVPHLTISSNTIIEPTKETVTTIS